MSNAELLAEKGIDLKRKTHGTIKTTCPKCSETRHDKKDPCLSVDIDTGLFNCHHCDFKGRVFEKKQREYIRPQARLEKLRPELIQWFEGTRGISNNTLLRFGITEATEWMPQFEKDVPVICFNYYRHNELTNIKFRGQKKAFKMAKDAELIFYNLDALQDQQVAVVVEGEMDCLTLYECGIYNSVSVPNGASKGNAQLEYLNNCWQSFEGISKIILWTDSDEAGFSLREELARRLGKERCYRVPQMEGCKDANEVLLLYGKEQVKECIENATPWPLEGIITMDEMYEDVCNYYSYGYPGGIDLHIDGIEDFIQLMPGQLTTITGIPGSGKSEWADYMMVQTAKHHEWSWGVCSFENQPPSFHVTKLTEKITGKAFSHRKDSNFRMNQKEFESGVYTVDRFFHFININEIDVTLDGILTKAKELVQRKGIKGLLIDPWNYIEHHIPKGYTETQYISESLTKIKSFAIRCGVHVFLIAHPTKIQKDKSTGKYEVPTLYSISGSAHFFNKTDNGLCVWRDFSSNTVEIHVQKVRYSWLGHVGMAAYSYNVNTRQYQFQA
jgi:twinkle protein